MMFRLLGSGRRAVPGRKAGALVIFSVLPWLALTLANGGPHSHHLLIPHRPTTAEALAPRTGDCQVTASPGQFGDSERGSCAACLWQYSANAQSVSPCQLVTDPAATEMAAARPTAPVPSAVLCSDARGPPSA